MGPAGTCRCREKGPFRIQDRRRQEQRCAGCSAWLALFGPRAYHTCRVKPMLLGLPTVREGQKKLWWSCWASQESVQQLPPTNRHPFHVWSIHAQCRSRRTGRVFPGTPGAVGAPLQHRAHASRPGVPPRSPGRRPRTGAAALGFGSPLGGRPVRRREGNQRQSRNRRGEANLPPSASPAIRSFRIRPNGTGRPRKAPPDAEIADKPLEGKKSKGAKG